MNVSRSAILALLLSLGSCCGGIAHWIPSGHASGGHGGGCMSGHGEPPPAASPTHQAYVCPMHDEVTASFPTACPECGMDLVKR